MIPWFKDLLWDETCFIRYSRLGLYVMYVVVSQGLVPGFAETKIGWWIAQFLPAVALFLGAGDKNPPKEVKP